MALAHLGGARRPENYTWPGFVDALATLLMVIIFVLLVFVLIQVNLAYRVAGQDATMNDMRAQIVSLGDLLNLERKANEELKDELAGISSLLDDTTKERDSLGTQLANATATLSLRDSASGTDRGITGRRTQNHRRTGGGPGGHRAHP